MKKFFEGAGEQGRTWEKRKGTGKHFVERFLSRETEKIIDYA